MPRTSSIALPAAFLVLTGLVLVERDAALPERAGAAAVGAIDAAAADPGTPNDGPAAATAPPLPPPVRTIAGFAPEPQTMADVHALRARTAAATAEAIPALRRTALAAGNPLAAGLALQALGRLRAVAGDAELLALVDDPRPRVRQELVAALGTSGDPTCATTLAAATRDADETTRTLAIRALGVLGGRAAHSELQRLQARTDLTRVERTFLRDALRAAAGAGPVFTPQGQRVASGTNE
ncbi:MAG: HEAT repeat domain-containing protein [Planctomycetes bacterium]|nr:HEAT repeat domain-containing protein [Planctomycetota bacterium]